MLGVWSFVRQQAGLIAKKTCFKILWHVFRIVTSVWYVFKQASMMQTSMACIQESRLCLMHLLSQPWDVIMICCFVAVPSFYPWCWSLMNEEQLHLTPQDGLQTSWALPLGFEAHAFDQILLGDKPRCPPVQSAEQAAYGIGLRRNETPGEEHESIIQVREL